jgi:hypothetical protein
MPQTQMIIDEFGIEIQCLIRIHTSFVAKHIDTCVPAIPVNLQLWQR